MKDRSRVYTVCRPLGSTCFRVARYSRHFLMWFGVTLCRSIVKSYKNLCTGVEREKGNDEDVISIRYNACRCDEASALRRELRHYRSMYKEFGTATWSADLLQRVESPPPHLTEGSPKQKRPSAFFFSSYRLVTQEASELVRRKGHVSCSFEGFSECSIAVAMGYRRHATLSRSCYQTQDLSWGDLCFTIYGR